MTLSYASRITICLVILLQGTKSYSDIYQWVDESGRIHYSDRRAAQKDAAVVGAPSNSVTEDGMMFTFLPQADALLNSSGRSPQGKASMLSTGYWTTQGATLETISLIQFDITALLTELNKSKHKHLANATLELYANTEDKLYGQGITNRESPGHSTLQGDNAFYLKPTRNNWTEDTVTWASFFDNSSAVPSAIRQLPVVSVAGSDGQPDKNYLVDVTELVAGLVLAQLREITLEMSPQRTSNMAQVTFYARESDGDKGPKLIINLQAK